MHNTRFLGGFLAWAFLCGTWMFFPCVCGFPLGTLASFYCLKTCMLMSLNLTLGMSLDGCLSQLFL